MTGIHYALCDMADCVNSMYGLQILVDFTSEISESEGITRAIGISVVWLTLVIIRLVAITASCSATTAEANYTAQVLQRILLEPGLHPHAMRNAQLFLHTLGTGFSIWTSSLIMIYILIFIEFVTMAQFVNLVFLFKQKFQTLNRYIARGINSPEKEANDNPWETLLQKSCVQNLKSVEDQTLRLDGFYQALTRSHNNLHHFSCVSNQNGWLHNERLRFRALRVIYDVLCDMCASVNSMYGLQVLLCMVLSFFEITTNLSYVIVSINVKGLQVLDFTTKTLFWALVHFLLLFCVTGSCNAASCEANRSAILLQKLLLRDLHPATAEEVKLFLIQASNRKVNFTAWDFFTINYTILGSIVGGITTLLVILVPFQNEHGFF
ncbi:uncharacterized protein LOC110831780 [Zootermopsis nevadensis]|uniref:uncharacterized protein LOC110831780 n=1 Tax=Zootermopsis nevadensis TaxID=136037 RepID=UPI000B8E4987|nr:uncharacterized protein LOC110831780 [Zootermopsis nevadensis]